MKEETASDTEDQAARQVSLFKNVLSTARQETSFTGITGKLMALYAPLREEFKEPLLIEQVLALIAAASMDLSQYPVLARSIFSIKALSSISALHSHMTSSLNNLGMDPTTTMVNKHDVTPTSSINVLHNKPKKVAVPATTSRAEKFASGELEPCSNCVSFWKTKENEGKAAKVSHVIEECPHKGKKKATSERPKKSIKATISTSAGNEQEEDNEFNGEDLDGVKLEYSTVKQ